jgi:hypothetical protein
LGAKQKLEDIEMIKASALVAIGMWAASAPLHAFNQWNVNATSCVADAGSIRGDLYIGTGGTVKFASAKTGDIVLYCPVSSKLDFTPSILALVYYDDTSAAGNHVTAQLIKMYMGNGSIASIATVDSDNGPVSGNGNANYVVREFTDNYDPTNYAYYIRIDIVRNSTAANETAYGVALQQ